MKTHHTDSEFLWCNGHVNVNINRPLQPNFRHQVCSVPLLDYQPTQHDRDASMAETDQQAVPPVLTLETTLRGITTAKGFCCTQASLSPFSTLPHRPLHAVERDPCFLFLPSTKSPTCCSCSGRRWEEDEFTLATMQGRVENSRAVSIGYTSVVHTGV